MTAIAADEPELTISPEKVCFIIIKAREFDAKEEASDPDSGSNAADDKMIDVLEESTDDPVQEELIAAISSLNFDEQTDLVALAWLGRDDVTVEDWPDLKARAETARERPTAAYLLGMPLLSDYLENGLSAFGHTCEDYEIERL